MSSPDDTTDAEHGSSTQPPTQPVALTAAAARADARSDRRNVLLGGALYFGLCASYSCVMPFIPVYFQYEGLGDVAIGAIGAARPIVVAIASPFFSAIGDITMHYYKHIFMLTLVLSTVLRALIPAAENLDVWAMIVVVMIAEFAGAPTMSLVDFRYRAVPRSAVAQRRVPPCGHHDRPTPLPPPPQCR